MPTLLPLTLSSVEIRCFPPATQNMDYGYGTITSLIRKQCPFYSRLTWRVCGQCLLIEGEPWRLNWVSPTLRHLLQLDKVSSMSMTYDYDYDLYFDHNPLVLTILPLRREEQEQQQHFCWNSLAGTKVLRCWSRCWGSCGNVARPCHGPDWEESGHP